MVLCFLICQKASEYSEFNRILLFYIYIIINRNAKIGVGVPKFLGEMALLRDAYFPEGMPSFLGNWSGGAKIPRKNGTGVQNFVGFHFSCHTGCLSILTAPSRNNQMPKQLYKPVHKAV